MEAGGAAQGAAAGAAVAGPYGALIGAGASILSSAVARPPTSSTSLSGAPINSWFDGSGWTVATGKASAKGGDRADAVGGISPLMIAAVVVGILVWKLTSKKS